MALDSGKVWTWCDIEEPVPLWGESSFNFSAVVMIVVVLMNA